MPTKATWQIAYTDSGAERVTRWLCEVLPEEVDRAAAAKEMLGVVVQRLAEVTSKNELPEFGSGIVFKLDTQQSRTGLETQFIFTETDVSLSMDSSAISS